MTYRATSTSYLNSVTSIADVSAERTKREDDVTSTKTQLGMFLGKRLSTQARKKRLIESLKSLIECFSTDRLEGGFPPANMSVKKGLPNIKKQDKTGEGHKDEKKSRKKRKRREEAEFNKKGKRAKMSDRPTFKKV